MSNAEAGQRAAPGQRGKVAAAIAAALLAATGATAAQEAEALPFVRLYDTKGAAAEPLPAETLANRPGWSLVPEGDVMHAIAGDAVLANDALAVVIRRKGAGAELYARAENAWQRRSVLSPCAAAGDAAARLLALRIVENTPAAGMLEATFETAAGRRAAGRFRLTTGVPMVEFRAGKGTQRLCVADNIRRLVVPELFTHDVVLAPEAMMHTWEAIPTENILLALLDGHDALATIVWRSVERNADALRHVSRKDAFGGCQIECPEGEGVWYGLLEAEGIWHEHALAAAAADRTLRLPWRPPFPARWRAGFAYAEGHPGAFDIAAEKPAEEIFCPAWLEEDAVCIRVAGPQGAPEAESRPADPVPLPKGVVVYPIDRSAATPLAMYCPVDVMRNALGVGVCQYVLDAEGMGDSGEATPAEVATWLERTFRRRNAADQAEAVQERLNALVKHVRQVNERYVGYLELGKRLADRCEEAERDPSLAFAAKELGRLLLGMARAASEWGKDDADPRAAIEHRDAIAESFELSAGEIVKLVGKPEAAETIPKAVRAYRSLGLSLDGALADARLTLRRVRARCRTLAATRPDTATFVRAIQQEADRALRPKRPAAPAAEGDKR